MRSQTLRWNLDEVGSDFSVRYVRGAVFHLTPEILLGPNGEIYPSEEHKSRPYLLMSNAPYDRMLKGLKVQLLPMSTKVDYASEHVTINSFGNRRAVLTDMATSAYLDANGDATQFQSVIGFDDMVRISTSLSKQFQLMDHKKASCIGAPGSIVEIPWDGANRRDVLIVGSSHLDNSFSPVVITPVDTLASENEEITGIELRPIACQRMVQGKYKSRLHIEGVQQIQAAALASYGL
jgi:hypothetical protein